MAEREKTRRDTSAMVAGWVLPGEGGRMEERTGEAGALLEAHSHAPGMPARCGRSCGLGPKGLVSDYLSHR